MAKSNSKPKLRQRCHSIKARLKAQRPQRVRLHRSFRRSYREDYLRPVVVPGLLQHFFQTLGHLRRNWRNFGLLLLFSVLAFTILVGLMSEETYKELQDIIDESSLESSGGDIGAVAKAGLLLIYTVSSGGFSGNLGSTAQIFLVLIFLLTWLLTIYLLRHKMAGHTVKFRQGLYNAFAPLVSTFCVLVVIMIELIPVFVVIVASNAAVATGFLATPFYALLFFIFAVAMFIISGYLLSSSVMALVAVSAPGLYPLAALRTASDLMLGRRIKFIIRLLYLMIMLAIIWVLVLLPVMLLDMWLKSSFTFLPSVPTVPITLLVMTCCSFIYATAYFYLYYRKMLAYEES